MKFWKSYPLLLCFCLHVCLVDRGDWDEQEFKLVDVYFMCLFGLRFLFIYHYIGRYLFNSNYFMIDLGKNMSGQV